jgi:hypothetical protein
MIMHIEINYFANIETLLNFKQHTRSLKPNLHFNSHSNAFIINAIYFEIINAIFNALK